MNSIIWLQLNNKDEGEEKQNEKNNFSQGGHHSKTDNITHLATANTSTEA